MTYNVASYLSELVANEEVDNIEKAVRYYFPYTYLSKQNCRLDLENSNLNCLQFQVTVFHLDDQGVVDKETNHTVTARPGFSELDLQVTGENYNQINQELFLSFCEVLLSEYDNFGEDTNFEESLSE